MNILLLTNTYLPHVGGVARSVQAFAGAYRQQGHRVLIVAPTFAGMPEREDGVVRVPAVQNFNASDFSVALPIPAFLTRTLDDFEPDLVHSQHPFLLGMTAIRIARGRGLPLVFTHHTLYEEYTHYVPGDSPALRKFVIELSTRYANLCDQVLAPSESVRQLLLKRGVTQPLEVIPTGVDFPYFSTGDGEGFRQRHGLPADALVIGHMGRLAPEKNLGFLASAVAEFIAKDSRNIYFLVVGGGPSEGAIRQIFTDQGLQDKLCLAGVQKGRDLVDGLHAMDLFTFTSLSETQGMVLTEAMAAGLPVLALDASGVREVLRDGQNGRMLASQDLHAFGLALQQLFSLPAKSWQAMREKARQTANALSIENTARQALQHYRRLIELSPRPSHRGMEEQWELTLKRIKAEWDILSGLAAAADSALGKQES
ncbi:glycosyltransferase [Bowmanella dokdonensis]|uniref:glycosyltransferase n=1 Tax=Bowmanella dokdonensis TaxID=751969 RepID=UPI001F49F7B6|nr:glycosyltransferase [Bowmanella dokdonensis]